jgi:hypothetical protein
LLKRLVSVDKFSPGLQTFALKGVENGHFSAVWAMSGQICQTKASREPLPMQPPSPSAVDESEIDRMRSEAPIRSRAVPDCSSAKTRPLIGDQK